MEETSCALSEEKVITGYATQHKFVCGHNKYGCGLY